MRLVYWVAKVKWEDQIYSLRARTKKEILALFRAKKYNKAEYFKPVRIEMEYENGFDLMLQCLRIGGVAEEALTEEELREL